MERYRLKNIIILILLLVNVSLLASLLYRQSEKRTMLRRSEEELITLFAASDITLSHSAISWNDPLPGVTMTRSAARERELATFLLGSGVQEVSQGGINTYYNAAGSVQCRANGSFDAKLQQFPEDTEAFCKQFSSTFSCSEAIFSLDETGSGTATALCKYEKHPIYNSTVTFTLSEGDITAISGMLLPESGTATGEPDLLSCAAALTTFLQMRLEEGTVGSSILSTHLCYESQSTPASSISLVSVWCIETDIASYYVNCSSGAITVG